MGKQQVLHSHYAAYLEYTDTYRSLNSIQLLKKLVLPIFRIDIKFKFRLQTQKNAISATFLPMLDSFMLLRNDACSWTGSPADILT